jgi:hypothetical protein
MFDFEGPLFPIVEDFNIGFSDVWKIDLASVLARCNTTWTEIGLKVADTPQ